MTRIASLSLACLAMLGLASPVLASDQPLALLGAPLGQEQLGGTRARGVDPGTLASNSAVSMGNTVVNSHTGDISMAGSMNNNSGITTVFQNTGNNVVFQNATSIGITVR